MTDRPVTQDPARYRELGWWRDQTFVDDLRRFARETPDKLAVVGHYRLGDQPDRLLSYAELARLVDRFAGGLLELGVRRGDVVAVDLLNTWEAAVLTLACARIGAVVSPVVVFTGPRELRQVLGRTAARVCVVLERFGDRPLAEELAGMRRELPTLEHPVVLGDAAASGALDLVGHFVETPWEDKHPAEELDAQAPAADDLFQLLYTSGTTGEPKGVMHSHNTLYAMARSVSVPLELGPDTVVNTPMAMTHQAGFTYGLLMPLVLGGTSVWVDSYGGDGGHLLDTMERYRVTFAYLNPDGVAQLVAAQRQRRRTGLRLRSWATGSAPIPPQLPAEADAAFGVQLHALWGTTENGAVTATRPGDPRDWAARSDGRPVPWMETRIVDEQGAAVAEGQVGRLLVRGANQCLGYYRAEAVYRELVDADGWFDTGDLARSDGRGGIKIAGRVKDVINRGGLQVPAVEVENQLRRHPKVADVAVVGEPYPGVGERVAAFVVPAAGGPPDLDELRAHLLAVGMTAGWWPERLELLEAIPKNPNGKVQKRELRERLKAG